MARKPKSSLVDTVKRIGDDAVKILEAIKAKADDGADLTRKERDTIRALVKRSEDAFSDASKRAKARRKEQVVELKELIKNIDLALTTPGLDQGVRRDLRSLRRRRRARLVRLETRETMAFAGILTAREIREIADVLKRAKQDVRKKKNAAAFVGTVMKVADLALGIAAKGAAAM